MFKIIKSTDWTSSTGEKGTTYVVAYKGRAFVVNSNDFENLKEDKTAKTLKLGEPADVVREEYLDDLGDKKFGLRLKPKMDLDLAVF